MGRKWLEEYRRREDPHMVPNSLPDRPALEGLIQDLPLQIEAYRDEKDLYIAVLQVRAHLISAEATSYCNAAFSSEGQGCVWDHFDI